MAPALVVGALALVLCGWLGWWQWTRAHDQAVTVQEQPAAPLVDLIEPGVAPGGAIGRRATVSGVWLDAEAALVTGREVDGVPAVFLVRPLLVADGTESTATLAVLVGWAPADAVQVAPLTDALAELSGYLRASEGATTGGTTDDRPEVDGAFWSSAASTASFAQVWPSPVYSPVFVSEQGEPGWEPLPPREPPTRLDIRSLAYAFEWWAFGAFAVFLAARYVRDNVNVRNATPTEDSADD